MASGGLHERSLQTTSAVSHGTRRGLDAIVALHVVRGAGVGVGHARRVSADNPFVVAGGGGARARVDLLAVVAARAVGDSARCRDHAVSALDVVLRARVRVDVAVRVGALDALVVAVHARALAGEDERFVVAARAGSGTHGGGVLAVVAGDEVGGAGVGVDHAVGVGAADAGEGALGAGALRGSNLLAVVALGALRHGTRGGRSAIVALHVVVGASVRVHHAIGISALETLVVALGGGAP